MSIVALFKVGDRVTIEINGAWSFGTILSSQIIANPTYGFLHTEWQYDVDVDGTKHLFVSEDKLSHVINLNPDTEWGGVDYGYLDEKVIKKDCLHVWKRHNGLFESFEYCVMCDQKR